jgi:hypothetical protein
MFQSAAALCDETLPEASIYRFLHRETHRLFPDEAFGDLFQARGRNCVPPSVLAAVMVLQRIEGLSDREAVERFTFDVRWRYAAGVDTEFPGFVHTVLVDMRARLRRSERPNRIFEVVLDVAKRSGLVGKKRVLDSTALYDAVATQDTVTMVRSAIRGVLRVADAALAAELRAVLRREDDYATAGKPQCDWDDERAREDLVDALVRDASAILALVDGRTFESEMRQAMELLTTVVGQDIEQREDGLFRIARRVAPDRIISTVDPEARHGHKTAARSFDGFKAHVSVDPDSEIITATAVTPGNAGDGSVAKELLQEALSETVPVREQPEKIEVFGDASYGSAEVVDHVESAGGEPNLKVQQPPAARGMFSKNDFQIDLGKGTVRCPAKHLVVIQTREDGSGLASFDARCDECPIRARCTTSTRGRQIKIHSRERTLEKQRSRQRDPNWRSRYRATRPKVERKIGQLVRRRHGGRRARLRGVERNRLDFATLAAAVNLQRIAKLRSQQPK